MDIDQIEVIKNEFSQARQVTYSARKIETGEVLVKIDKFALTANNVSYALTGAEIGYWQFFPTNDPYGIVPVWGFADVVETKADGVNIGDRLWGYFPMASHLIMKPTSIRPNSFMDGALHRQSLPMVYNNYQITNNDFPELAALENARSLVFPLFLTSYVIYDFLLDNDWFGASQILIGSASSKTAFGFADIVKNHSGERPKLIGLTSANNVEFVKNLGFYDEVFNYSQINEIAADVKTGFVDMAGDRNITTAIHKHFAQSLVHSTAIGATHWEVGGANKTEFVIPHKFLFAPTQFAKRDAEWGRGVLMRKGQTECIRMSKDLDKTIEIVNITGPSEIIDAWKNLVDGKTSPKIGLICSMD